jgi:superfamily II DNA or RNA helicase
MSNPFAVGALVRARDREWVVLPDSSDQLLILRPLGGTEEEVTGIYLPLESVEPARFHPPTVADLGDFRSAQLLRDALRLGFRSSAGPFRSFAHLGIDPRPYQLVPLLLALKLDPVRLLIADDVGIGKTIEAALIARELLDRGEIHRLAVLCPPQLAEQWQRELKQKFNLESAIVLPSTAPRLERGLPPGDSLFDHNPIVIVSLDFIKAERRRAEFLRTCPEFVIVDEAHTCAQSGEGKSSRHQRHQLVRQLSDDPARHLVLVTATPHSGKEDAFRSLLTLLKPEFAALPADLSGPANEASRRQLAQHFVQRRRADIRHFLQEDTPFPDREEKELSYTLSKPYRELFDAAIAYAREVIATAEGRAQRLQWWSALALLRALASSPAAARATLLNRAATIDAPDEDINDIGRRTVLDLTTEDSLESIDVIPGSDTEASDDSQAQHRRKLRAMAKLAEAAQGKEDSKLAQFLPHLAQLLKDGYHPIVFCRFIDTAEYLKDELRKSRLIPKSVVIDSVTGLLPPEEREARVQSLSENAERILIATDCLSEGINLQSAFSAVVHYDLSWNPTRHEQREGRVDRYGQPSPKVRVVTYYGQDNGVDGIVLKVLLTKHKTIRTSLGISVPIPANSEELIEAIFEGILLRQRPENVRQMTLDLDSSMAAHVHQDWQTAAEREGRSRTMFAQETIKFAEVASELDAIRQAIGSGVDVDRFYRAALQLRQQPIPKSIPPFHRTHPLIESLATGILDDALDSQPLPIRAARAGVARSAQVQMRTTLLLLRIRHQIHSRRDAADLLAEDCLLLAFTGAPQQAQWLPPAEVERLLTFTPDANIAPELQAQTLTRILDELGSIEPHLNEAAHARAAELLAAHQRVRQASRAKGAQESVIAQLPPDILGLYVFLPMPTSGGTA